MGKSDTCTDIITVTFGIVNLVILVFGLALLGVGIRVLVSDGHQISGLIGEHLYTGTAILVTTAGALISLVSLLGCWGAFQESKCLLTTFFCLVLVLFILTFSAAVAAFVLGGSSFLDGIGSEMLKTIDDYGSNDAVTNGWDFLQQDFQCCGVYSYKDWKGLKNVPSSCCRNDGCEPSFVTQIYQNGCLGRVKDFIMSNSKLFGGVTIAVVIFLLASMIISCVIIKSVG